VIKPEAKAALADGSHAAKIIQLTKSGGLAD